MKNTHAHIAGTPSSATSNYLSPADGGVYSYRRIALTAVLKHVHNNMRGGGGICKTIAPGGRYGRP